MEQLPLDIVRCLPIQPTKILYKRNGFQIFDKFNDSYFLCIWKKDKRLQYEELSKYEFIEKFIYEKRINDKFYVLFKNSNHPSEKNSIIKSIIPKFEKLFDNYKFSLELKHEYGVSLTNLYKVLDSRFTYFEIRIREIELAIKKYDYMWLFLSKYYIILDTKIILYDLQKDIFDLIDKKVNVEYGLVCKLNDIEIIKNGLIKPISEFYYAPISTYYARLYLLSNDEYVIKYIKKKLSNSFDFYKKHFCFYVLYIYILNININDVLSYNSLGAYLSILRQINFFLEEFKNFYR